MNEWGIDVSRWQGSFNFEKAKAEGVKFAILKAGGGDAGLYKDGKLDRNYAECTTLGIPCGAYFFGQAMDVPTALKEAEYFLSLIKGRKLPMGVWYDVEAKMLNANGLSAIVLAFIQRVNAAGYNCGVYASESVFKAKFKNGFDSVPKWVARWAKTKPSIACQIWQFGGETNLIRSNRVAGQVCDQNYLLTDIPVSNAIPTPNPMPPTTTTTTKEEYNMPTIKKGNKGQAVKIWQIIIGATPDGIFGPITEANTRKFQKSKGLVADGIVGPKSWKVGLESVK